MGKNIRINLSDKYSQKLLDHTEQSGETKVVTDTSKTASKRAIQKTAEATGNLIGYKVADKIARAGSQSAPRLLQKQMNLMKLLMNFDKYKNTNRIKYQKIINFLKNELLNHPNSK